MVLPAFPSYPSGKDRENASSTDWRSFQEGCTVLTRAYLQLDSEKFKVEAESSTSLLAFIESFVTTNATYHPTDQSIQGRQLRKQCFLLVHRLYNVLCHMPDPFLSPEFLGDLATIYGRLSAFPDLVEYIWSCFGLDTRPDYLKSKNALIRELEIGLKESHSQEVLRRVGALLHCSPHYGNFLMVGSDFMDSIVSCWRSAARETRKKLSTIAYWSLMSLVDGQTQRLSLLIDHLYTLKADNDKAGTDITLLKTLVTTTPFVRKLLQDSHVAESGRAKSMIQYLESLNTNTLKHKRVRPEANKGKAVLRDESGYNVSRSGSIHRVSLVTELQDLFPDLGSGFIAKLLDEYADDVESVTAHVLDNSLPPHLENADKAERIDSNVYETADYATNLAPASTPPDHTSRRNVFDDDAFAKLNIAGDRVHLGRRDSSLTLGVTAKASILAALAAFDADDDERDDTFDVADVGGTIDTTEPSSDVVDADRRAVAIEETLFSSWKTFPGVFNRDGETRRSARRATLKSETGMTDEAIEGWAVMLGRNVGQLRRLEAKYTTFTGDQMELAATSWHAADDDGSGMGDSSGQRSARGSRGGRGRGRGQTREDRDTTTGDTGDNSTQARHRKDINKAQRANHNRRQQRAKKVARAGFPG